MSRFEALHLVEQIGVGAAAQVLCQIAADAGQFVLGMQPFMSDRSLPNQVPQKPGESFASALTNADIACQTMIASRVFTLFGDAGFYGEEAEQDRVSAYFPKDRPYTITADPINGTRYYKDGLPLFEVILTLCKGDEMLAAVICQPAKHRIYRAVNDSGNHSLKRIHLSASGQMQVSEWVDLSIGKKNQVVLLGKEYAEQADLFRDADIQPVFPWRDYSGQTDWHHSSSGILDGECIGIANVSGQLIDAGAIAFAVSCGGGQWLRGPLDREAMRYPHCFAATDRRVVELFQKLH